MIAVRREREELDPRAKPPSDEIGSYATSLAAGELTDSELLEVIRGHWSAIENGVHHRRDVSFGEDASRVAQRSAAHAKADETALGRARTRQSGDKGRAGT